jgi:hypothetical protein
VKQLAFKKLPSGAGMGHVNGLPLDRQQRNVWTVRTGGLEAPGPSKRGCTPILDVQNFSLEIVTTLIKKCQNSNIYQFKKTPFDPDMSKFAFSQILSLTSILIFSIHTYLHHQILDCNHIIPVVLYWF